MRGTGFNSIRTPAPPHRSPYSRSHAVKQATPVDRSIDRCQTHTHIHAKIMPRIAQHSGAPRLAEAAASLGSFLLRFRSLSLHSRLSRTTTTRRVARLRIIESISRPTDTQQPATPWFLSDTAHWGRIADTIHLTHAKQVSRQTLRAVGMHRTDDAAGEGTLTRSISRSRTNGLPMCSWLVGWVGLVGLGDARPALAWGRLVCARCPPTRCHWHCGAAGGCWGRWGSSVAALSPDGVDRAGGP